MNRLKTVTSLLLVVSAMASAAETTDHGRVGEYRLIENGRAFIALTPSVVDAGGAFSFGCAKSTNLCGHLLHFPDAVPVPDAIEHVVFKVDEGAIHIIAAMAYGESTRGASLVLSDLALEDSSTFTEGESITFWPGVVSSAMPGANTSRTFSLAGYRESVRAVRSLQAQHVSGKPTPNRDTESGEAQSDQSQRSLRQAIRRRNATQSE